MSVTSTRHLPRGSGNSGFTLIELIITVALVAILLAVALPSFREINIGMNVSSNTNELIGALNLARSEAVKRGRDVAVVASDGANWANGWEVNVVGDPEKLQERPGYGDYPLLAISSGGGDDASIVFGSAGNLRESIAYDFSVCRPTTHPGARGSRWIHVEGSGVITSRKDTSASPAGECE
ncbi:MAG TPA: GspH/FimT family pseudopilin [Dokdonella sp.]